MSVNIFGSSGKHASGVNSNVGLGGVDRNFNQRFIMLSNKLAQKINKSGHVEYNKYIQINSHRRGSFKGRSKRF